MIDYINHTKHKVYLYLLHRTIVRKGVPAPHFKSHTPWPRSPLFKIFVSLPLFSVPPPIKVIKSFPHPYATPSYPNPTNHPSLHIINKFEQISKGWFYQFNCRFQSKINFLNKRSNKTGASDVKMDQSALESVFEWMSLLGYWVWLFLLNWIGALTLSLIF